MGAKQPPIALGSIVASKLKLIKDTGHRSRAPCHTEARIYATLGDGVIIGWCEECDAAVVRKNPRTGELEWLNGESPWSSEDATE